MQIKPSVKGRGRFGIHAGGCLRWQAGRVGGTIDPLAPKS